MAVFWFAAQSPVYWYKCMCFICLCTPHGKLAYLSHYLCNIVPHSYLCMVADKRWFLVKLFFILCLSSKKVREYVWSKCNNLIFSLKVPSFHVVEKVLNQYKSFFIVPNRPTNYFNSIVLFYFMSTFVLFLQICFIITLKQIHHCFF